MTRGRLLALDGALGSFSCAVVDGRHLRSRSIRADRTLEGGLALIAATLAEAGLALGDLEAIAVGIGPGSFTGLRIADRVCEVAGAGRRLPLVPVSSYDALEPAGLAGAGFGRRHRPAGHRVPARLRMQGERFVACGPVRETIAGLAAKAAGDVMLAGATEDVLDALAEGALRVHIVVPPRRARGRRHRRARA